jgi:hypothetical protein
LFITDEESENFLSLRISDNEYYNSIENIEFGSIFNQSFFPNENLEIKKYYTEKIYMIIYHI